MSKFKFLGLNPINLFGIIIVIIIFIMGLGMLLSNMYTEIISGRYRTILGVIFIIYSLLRAIRIYQNFTNTEVDEDIV